MSMDAFTLLEVGLAFLPLVVLGLVAVGFALALDPKGPTGPSASR